MMAATDQSAEQSLALESLLKDIINNDGQLKGLRCHGLAMQSQKINAGDWFVAIAGRKQHGLIYAHDAVNRGAVGILCETTAEWHAFKIKSLEKALQVPVIVIKTLTHHLGLIAERFYNFPSAKMKVIGITGTNGKTSCSHFTAQALVGSVPCAVLGTMGNGFLDNIETATHTTPDILQVHKLLAKYHDQGAQTIAMEVSSHGLDQGRIAGVHIDTAVYTNLSRDHLDYHQSMPNYLAAKCKLFQVESLKHAVINIDDEYSQHIRKCVSDRVNCIYYGMNENKIEQTEKFIRAVNIQLHHDGVTADIISNWGQSQIKSPLMGRFNIYNILAVAATLIVQGIDFKTAIQKVNQLTGINGRMEKVSLTSQATVIIDYAHTPDALENALQTLTEHTTGKLLCVLGCGGNRDKGKRPLMGHIAEKYSDHVILTDDNPRFENGNAIIRDMVAGMIEKKPTIVRNRTLAIETAINHAEVGDIILIAGKGHEIYQEIKGQKNIFSDRDVAQEILNSKRVDHD